MNQQGIKESQELTGEALFFDEEEERWPETEAIYKEGLLVQDSSARSKHIKKYVKEKLWLWPDKSIYFLCDIHADTEAFLRSLSRSGCIKILNQKKLKFELTDIAKDSLFVIGGDCFDKGPENLKLLRTLKKFRELGGNLKILAGNHDLRTLAGFAYAESKEPLLEHLLIRMGKKAIPLYQEIIDQYLDADKAEKEVKYSDEEIRRRLYPRESWFNDFPKAVNGIITEKKLNKELKRIREKISEFEERREKEGISLKLFYAAVQKAIELFVKPGGEFSWYFDEMDIAFRAGSFLFVHAGVDDLTAKIIRTKGVDGLNEYYNDMRRNNLFELYHGVLGNCFRTKYRDHDYPLTESGVKDLHGSAIYAIVHGHRNILNGQRIMFREGMLNFECDCSLDANTRKSFDLEGLGFAVTHFNPDGRILGMSKDYPKVKVFAPHDFGGVTTQVYTS